MKKRNSTQALPFILLLFLFINAPRITSVCISDNSPWLWDIDRLKDIRQNLNRSPYSTSYIELLKEAEEQLVLKPYSVTYKEKLPPNRDKHDYVSLSRYWWPDSTKKNGMPYIVKDGQSNPELEKYDRNPLAAMCKAVNTLSLAYFYSKDEKYALKAVDFVRTWFLNENTRMNPNLNYSQFIPGVNDSKGSSYGLIDTYSFVDMLNSIKLLEGSEAYTHNDKQKLQKWFADFAIWWQESEQGKKERAMDSNHGLAYDVQLVMYLLFAGETNAAKEIMNAFPENRLFKQIDSEGKQARELRRTLAFGYSIYNIRHMIDMILIAKNYGIELWKSESRDGRSFYKAVDFLVPYLGKNVEEWPYQQINSWDVKQRELKEDLYRILSFDPYRYDYAIVYSQNPDLEISYRIPLLFGKIYPYNKKNCK